MECDYNERKQNNCSYLLVKKLIHCIILKGAYFSIDEITEIIRIF